MLAFSTALASVGIRAQAGGTAVSRAFINIANEVAEGGEKVVDFAEVAGVSVDKFTRLFKEDAAGALLLFVKGLDRAQRSGVNVFRILEDVGLADIRVRDAILGLSITSESLADAIALGNSAFEENIALNREAAIFFDALANRIITVGNQIRNAAALIGEAFGPQIDVVLEKVSEFALKAQDFARELALLPDSTKKFILAVIGIGVALGPILIILGTFISILGFVTSSTGVFALGLLKLAKAARVAGGALRFLATGFLFTPLGLAVTAVGALISAFIFFKDTVITVGGETQKVLDFTIGLFQALGEAIFSVIEGPLEVLKSVWGVISAAAITAFDALKPVILGTFLFIQDVVEGVFTFLGKVYKLYVNTVIKGVQLIVLFYKTAFKVIQLLVTNAFDIITDKLDGITAVLSVITEPFVSVFETIGGFISDVFSGLATAAGKFFGFVLDGLGELGEKAKALAVGGLDKLKETLDGLSEPAEGTLGAGIPEAILEGLEKAEEIIAGDPLGDLWARAGELGGQRYAARLQEEIVKAAPLSMSIEDETPAAKRAMEDFAKVQVDTFNSLFIKGMKKALNAYVKEANDVAKLSQEAFENSFQKIEDGILDFIETGKFNFKDFALSITREFNKIAIKSLLADALSSAKGESISGTGFLAGLGDLVTGGGVSRQRETDIRGDLDQAFAASPDLFGTVGGVAGGAAGAAGDTAATAAITAGLTTLGASNTAGFTTLGATTTTGLTTVGTAVTAGFTTLGTANAAGFASIASAIAASGAATAVSSTGDQVAGVLAGLGSVSTGAEGGISTNLPKVLAPMSIFKNAKKFGHGGVTSGSDRIPAMLSPNEAVIPLSRNRAIPIEGSTGNTTVNITVNATDVDSFKRSESQILAKFGDSINFARRRTR